MVIITHAVDLVFFEVFLYILVPDTYLHTIKAVHIAPETDDNYLVKNFSFFLYGVAQLLPIQKIADYINQYLYLKDTSKVQTASKSYSRTSL